MNLRSNRRLPQGLRITIASLLGGVSLAAAAAAPVLNVYSARHYPSDTALYAGFTEQTGIQIKRVDADDAGILARLKAEGAGSPADVILLVDAARLHSAEQLGLFKPVQAPGAQARVPATLRSESNAQGQTAWFGISTRARVIVYDKQRFKAADVATYESLAGPALRGQVCLRSTAHPYNLSLFSAVLAQHGQAQTRAWLQGLRDNMARKPRGGDTDQIRGVASGECGVAITNSYYLARLMRSNSPADRAVVERVGVVFPGQSSWGTHVNVAGAAVAAHSQQPELAVRFIDYLASPLAQAHFAQGNNEWPVVPGVQYDNAALQAMAPVGFKRDATPIAQVGQNTPVIQRMLDELGLE
jgi:iron(III) transport system substrate-binding protein